MLIYKEPEACDEPHEGLEASDLLWKALPHRSCVQGRLMWFQLETLCTCDLI